MSRLAVIQRRIEFNERAEFSNCSAIHCPRSEPDHALEVGSWNCANCMVVTKKRFDNWMKEIDECQDLQISPKNAG